MSHLDPGPRHWAALACAAAAGLGCRDAGAPAPPPGPPPAAPDRPAVQFVERAGAAGLAGFHQRNGSTAKRWIAEAIGGGVALLDVEGDGDLDVYLTNAGAELPGDPDGGTAAPVGDALFRNDGRGRFTDVTEVAGLGDTRFTGGVEVADVDGDGRLDLFLTGFDGQRLLRQGADGRFEDVTDAAGLASTRWSTGAVFLDHDRDGDLDLFVVNHLDLDCAALAAERKRGEWRGREVYYGPHGLPAVADRFYRNRGDGTFEDVSGAVGVDALARYGFEAVALDADGDGWCDVYVANDGQPNTLWRNVLGQRFEDAGDAAGVALDGAGAALAGMGVAVGDADGDLALDLCVTNFSDEAVTLYLARGAGRFDDGTSAAGLAAPTREPLGWSCGLDDLDLDGDVDLWTVNGHVFPAAEDVDGGAGYLQPTQVFLNEDRGRFVQARDAGGGLAKRVAGRGGAAGDLDGDGDLDLVVGVLDGQPLVLFNETPPRGRAVILRLIDRAPNTTAHGASLTARAGERALARVVGSGAGFLSCGSTDVHLGVGDAPRLEDLTVRWADGEVEAFGGLEAGFRYVLRRDRGVVARTPLGRVR